MENNQPNENPVSNNQPDADQHVQQASEFINNTSLDKMLEIAEEAVRKKALERMNTPTQWVLPED